MISLTSLIPSGAIGSALGSTAVKSIFGGKAPSSHSASLGSSSDFASSLASMFAATPQTTANANAASTDPIAQLTALLQSGVPLTTIENKLASIITSAVQRAEPNATPSEIASIKASLMKSLANALSPPGTSPPSTAAQEATALATRLQQWIGAIAGEAGQAGQQNDIAGQVLDAKSARDIPAQQRKAPATSSLDAGDLARQLLSAVTTSLTQPSASESAALPAIASYNTPAPSLQTSAAAMLAQKNALVQPDPAVSPSDTPLAVTSATNSAPDLLARMLARAADVDARVNASPAMQSAQAQAGTVRTGDGAFGTTSNADLAERFANALANVVATATASDQGNSGGSGLGRDSGDTADDRSATTQSPTSTNATVPVATNTLTQLQTTVTAAPSQPAPVNADAVVEQMVKSMMMRTSQSGSSEIRLRLVPDSLGEVNMKITVQGSQISANVVAQNADVRNALMANHQQLARSLANAGLTLSGFSVDVSGGDAGKDNNRDRTGGFGRRYSVHELAAKDGESETDPASSIGPSLVSNSTLELLNYLA